MDSSTMPYYHAPEDDSQSFPFFLHLIIVIFILVVSRIPIIILTIFFLYLLTSNLARIF
ncbi:hypothetical protein HanXRQr2_Chr01g0040591 [Helianthus annuus]|uniref:Uncharacterized protein n=1 Tax=Helianthus annuus TaxID=4232 RepID=A0A9K3JXV0_HELAN|nr:hypothetical protein HanXRQr2_Chr01g0040591 [Helianthus annuus]KAJ0624616.1 hypothetical protein HanIR_Chr01g0044971 [Helianthus annuus]